eukprot:1145971-Pelagomonas_calceolata.AAC.1
MPHKRAAVIQPEGSDQQFCSVKRGQPLHDCFPVNLNALQQCLRGTPARIMGQHAATAEAAAARQPAIRSATHILGLYGIPAPAQCLTQQPAGAPATLIQLHGLTDLDVSCHVP